MLSAAFSPVEFRRLFYSLPDKYLLMGPDSTVLDLNAAHASSSLSGRSVEQVQGLNFFEVWPPNSETEADVVRNSQDYVRQHHAPDTMPLIRYDLPSAETATGYETRYWQATHYPVLDEQNELLYILQRTEDVTEQLKLQEQARLAQQALAESQERQRFILESLPILVWTTTPDGEVDYFNPRWLQFTGRTLTDSLGSAWLQDLHPDDQQTLQTRWEESVASGTEFQGEYRLRHHSGTYRWVLVRAAARRNAEGEVTMWVGGGTDIHEQKELVAELLQATEHQSHLSDQAYQNYQLAQSQRATFYQLFMEAPALIAIARGPQHVFEFANPLYQALFPGRELIGRTIAEALPEAVEQGFLALVEQVYQTGQPFHGNELPIQVLHPNTAQPHTIYLNFVYQAFREQDAIAGVSVFAHDVTQLVLARQQLLAGSPPDASIH